MSFTFPKGLLDATRLTKTGHLAEATAAIQKMLAATMQGQDTGAPLPGIPHAMGDPSSRSAGKIMPALAGMLQDLRDKAGSGGLHMPSGMGDFAMPAPPLDMPKGAKFLTCSFTNQAGTRPYKLYVPSSYQGQAVPLIVMLHGCTQSPDDFAAGTGMNKAAEEQTCLVAYPGQTNAANMQKCWNWFNAGDQHRDAGEPSLIAGITREVMQEYAVDPKRVFIAGLSAGGAAAAIMGDAYPDLYSAIGVHSGLACGAAQSMPQAFAAMQGNGQVALRHNRIQAGGRIVPAIVFHGDKDTTVHPRNGDAVVAQSAQGSAGTTQASHGQSTGGMTYERTLHTGTDGKVVVEQWVIHGAGHAWSGGNPAGSYTLPRGPDATKEMMRFFMEHPLQRQ